MTELYLIAHKVRGEPAFDIATHLTCPKCEGTNDHCDQCDGAGHWWIVPTSGHRAFPYWDTKLSELCERPIYDDIAYSVMLDVPPLPPSLRDHYITVAEASTDLIKVLGLIHAPLAHPPLKRRL